MPGADWLIGWKEGGTEEEGRSAASLILVGAGEEFNKAGERSNRGIKALYDMNLRASEDA
jgi:hypothetical protein